MAITIDVITLFPGMLTGFLQESIVGRAVEEGLVVVNLHNLRDYSDDVKHRTVDDRPFGGGPGMLLRPAPLLEAIEVLRTPESLVIYLCPDGEVIKTPRVKELAMSSHLILISGHYEGIDQRIRDYWVDLELSIGDYVLTNGTLPAAVLIDALSRQIPGVLGEEKSLTCDSFRNNLLAFPQYTRPEVFQGKSVPKILLSGNHAAIDAWRLEQQKEKTALRRPDLLK